MTNYLTIHDTQNCEIISNCDKEQKLSDNPKKPTHDSIDWASWHKNDSDSRKFPEIINVTDRERAPFCRIKPLQTSREIDGCFMSYTCDVKTI